MDERLKFIAGLLDGEKMAVLFRRFGVSRKTGYKILDRYVPRESDKKGNGGPRHWIRPMSFERPPSQRVRVTGSWIAAPACAVTNAAGVSVPESPIPGDC